MDRKTFEHLAQLQLGATLGAHGFFLNPQKPEDVVDDPPCAFFESTVTEFLANYPSARVNLKDVDAVTVRIILRGALAAELENVSLIEVILPGQGVLPDSGQLLNAFGRVRQELADFLSSSAPFPPWR